MKYGRTALAAVGLVVALGLAPRSQTPGADLEAVARARAAADAAVAALEKERTAAALAAAEMLGGIVQWMRDAQIPEAELERLGLLTINLMLDPERAVDRLQEAVGLLQMWPTDTENAREMFARRCSGLRASIPRLVALGEDIRRAGDRASTVRRLHWTELARVGRIE